MHKGTHGAYLIQVHNRHLIHHKQPLLNSQKCLEFPQEIIHRTSISDIQIHFQDLDSRPVSNPLI